MNTTTITARSPTFLKILAHDLRWQLLTALAYSDYNVQELVERIKEPQNLVSYHLRRMREQDVITERRSSADRRDVYYSLDLARFQERYAASLGSLHPALDQAEEVQDIAAPPLEHKPARVLFLCTANSARSQMAEALTRHLSQGRVEAFSAGSHPGQLHPYAVQVMASMGIDISQQRSKHFEEFLGQTFDRIITVCDRVRESCPIFPGDPERIHWSIPDPVAASGSEQEIFHAFEQVSLQLTNRIRFLLILLEREKRGTL